MQPLLNQKTSTCCRTFYLRVTFSFFSEYTYRNKSENHQTLKMKTGCTQNQKIIVPTQPF